MGQRVFLALSVLVLALSGAFADGDTDAASQGIGFVRVGCGGHVSLTVLQPRVLGGLMIRGHGPVLIARVFPMASRVTIIRSPMEARPVPMLAGGPEGLVRSMESLFALHHPLSLFQGDLEEIDRWHEARMQALEELHSNVLQVLARSDAEKSVAGGDDDEVTPADASRLLAQEGEDIAADASTAAAGEAVAEVKEGSADKDGSEGDASASVLEQMPKVTQSAGDETDIDWTAGGDFEWTPYNICGLVLVPAAFGLLVAMLLLSLSSLIYGCAEEPADALIVAETHVQTPLLKGAAEKMNEDMASVKNPLCDYDPPLAKQ